MSVTEIDSPTTIGKQTGNNTDPASSDDKLAQWLSVLRVPGIGVKTFHTILTQFESPRQFLELPISDIQQRISLKQNSKAFLRSPDWSLVEQDLRWAAQPNNHIITFADDSYPHLLREIPDPPPLLFVTGDPALLQYPQLAIVGSRNPSHGGEQTAFEFAKHLSNQGLLITSGMALGIDAASHRGALAGSGLTIAVAGTGLDRVYPAAHKSLAHEIAEQGVLISENVPGTIPKANNFPRRNRIISGLSMGVLVVEAAKQSGSLITARLAMEQGRDVFAVPGSIHNPLARGCHHLIRQGAKLVETSVDILEELGPQLSSVLSKLPQATDAQTAEKGSEQSPTNLQQLPSKFSNEHSIVFNVLGFEPATIDQLIQQSQLTAESVSSILVELELQGFIVSQGGSYSRTAI